MESLPDVYVRVQPIRLLCCNLCGKIFDCSDDLILHFAKHFVPGECMRCNQQLIEIGDTVYHLQLIVSCAKTEPTDWAIIVEDEACEEMKSDIKIEPLDVGIHTETVSRPSTSNLATASAPHNTTIDDLTWPDYPDDTDTDAKNSERSVSAENEPRRRRARKPRKHRPKATRDRKYECYICRKTFHYFPPLLRHVHAHYEGGPTCQICRKEYASEQNLKVHMRQHTGEKHFVCTYCGRAFYQRSNLDNHITTHTRSRDYQCKVCGKSYARQSILWQHQFVHTGKKPHKCKIDGCDRAYMYSVDLKRHLFGAHGIYTKKFECKVCGKILPENKLLVAHMRTHL